MTNPFDLAGRVGLYQGRNKPRREHRLAVMKCSFICHAMLLILRAPQAFREELCESQPVIAALQSSRPNLSPLAAHA
jgi:hypothetical protein